MNSGHEHGQQCMYVSVFVKEQNQNALATIF